MSSQPAQAIDLAPPGAAKVAPPLSAVEAQERLQLREGLRLRRSVDHFARAWYGAILSLILSGVAAKLFVDGSRGTSGLAEPTLSAGTILVSTLALAGWCFVTVYFLRSRRAARAEHVMLSRLQGLDERSPRPPELF